MAETLYLPNGTMEVVIGDAEKVFTDLVEEYLGRDCVNLYHSILEDYGYEKESAKDFEQNADGYLQMLYSARDALGEALKQMQTPGRLNKRSLFEKLRVAYDDLNNNL